MIDAQSSREQRLAPADDAIDNSGARDALDAQVALLRCSTSGSRPSDRNQWPPLCPMSAHAESFRNSAQVAAHQTRRKVHQHEDDRKNSLRWNDYVLATVAFLEHDMPALKMHRDRVASAGDGFFGNVLNLKLLDSLIEHFDRDYKYASTHIRR